MGARVPPSRAGPAAPGARAATPPPAPAPIRLELTSEPSAIAEVRRAVEAFAAAAGLRPVAPGELGLSVNEAVANVIRHAYGGKAGRPIVVTAESLQQQPPACAAPAA